MTKVVRTICVWSLGCVVTMSPAAHAGHARLAPAQSSPFYGVLRFLAPESGFQHHKRARVARAEGVARLADIRVAPARTHPAQRVVVLARAGLHTVRRDHVVRVAIVPSHPRSSYPPRFLPGYPYPSPPVAYAGAPAFAGYAPRYSPYSYVYRYGYQYPYYVYYVVPGY